MKLKLSVFFCLAALARVDAAPPAPIANEVRTVSSIFDQGLSSTYRAQLMVIAPGVAIDPPPGAESFESVANVTLTIDSITCYDTLIRPVLDGINASKWERKPLPGYPKANWRIVGPWGKTYLNFLIDEDGGLICSSGVWYKVDAKLIERMTKDFVELGMKNLPRNTVAPAPGKASSK